MTNGPRKKPDYDPTRQWGLKPAAATRTETGEATYMVSGHVVGGAAQHFVGETMGRDMQARAARKAAAKEADESLKTLLNRDKEGMRAVLKAREVGENIISERKSGAGKKDKKGDGGPKQERDRKGTRKANTPAVEPTTKGYSADIIRNLGFDPSMKPGQRRVDNLAVQNKVRHDITQSTLLFLLTVVIAERSCCAQV